MTKVITRKENIKNWTSLKGYKYFKRKFIRFYLYILINKLLGFEVEILDE